MMKVIYIAGRFRGRDGWEVRCNIHAAESAARRVVALGAMPLTPHSIGGNMAGTASDAFWLRGTLELMKRCDAVLVLPGYEISEGTKGEIAEARLRSIPVFLPDWSTGEPNWSKFEQWLEESKSTPSGSPPT